MTDAQPDYLRRNRAAWDGWADEYVASGERHWAEDEPSWGIWGIPESEVGMFGAGVSGLDVIELGCGTAYVSSWLAKSGAKPVGIDNSEAQLATARRLQAEHGIEFPLHHGNAEEVPYPDSSFDFAISEYGASIWCDPYAWIPEVARLLRPGGRLAFLVNAPMVIMCGPDNEMVPASDRLLRPYFGLHRVEWDDDDSVEFHLPHGEMIGLLRSNGFEIEALRELQPPEDAKTTYTWVDADWARKWPSEEVWIARLSRRPRRLDGSRNW